MQINGKSLILMAASLLMAACVEEKIDAPKVEVLDDANVTFAIGGAETKAPSFGAGVTAMSEAVKLDCVEGIDGLLLTEQVSSMDELYFPTKGTPVYTENIATIYPELAVTAYDGDNLWLTKDIIFNYKEDQSGARVYAHNYANETADEITLPKMFYIKAPADYSNESIKYEDGAISFSYESPLTAADQKDILFTSKNMESAESSNRVLLYHTLTAVKFKLSTSTSSTGKVTLNSISKIEFNGLYSKGDCVVTPSYEGDTFDTSNPDKGTEKGTEKSSTTVVWSNRSDNSKVISQTFTGDQTTGQTLSGSFPDSFFAGDTELKNINATDASLTFMMIPQEIKSNVTLKITYKFTEGVTEREGYATINLGEKLTKKDDSGNPIPYLWKAGELRTYSISLDDEVKVGIDDTVNKTEHTKTGLKITNTGTATSYMRVAIIGNWFTSSLTEEEIELETPIAITPCPELASTVESAASSQTVESGNWFKVGQYYYYKYPVIAGHTISSEHTLFSTLNVNNLYTDYRPYNNCHLRIAISVQAVRADENKASVTSAWGSEVAGQLLTTIQD